MSQAGTRPRAEGGSHPVSPSRPSPAEPSPWPRPDADGQLPRLVSVVIPAYNAAAVIGDQLDALARQTYAGAIEVIVADNGSTDRTREVVSARAAQLPAMRLVDAGGRPGASHARNVGSRAAAGDLIAYADADDVVEPGWVAALAEASRSADFLAGRPDLLNDASATDVDGTAWLDLPRGDLDFLPWALGGNCAVRTEVFREIGGWREDYPHGGDDVDFCWRVQLAGHPLRFVPEAVTGYRERETLRGLARQRFEFGTRAPQLYREFRHRGARRAGPGVVARRLAWLLTRSPYLLLSARLRRRWLAMAAGMAGRMWGSLRHRVVCL